LDYWIDSAFSVGGFVGHLSYVLLVISMLMRDISLLRLLVIASALTGIAYDLIWLRNPVGVFWEGLLLLVNSGQLYLLWRRDRNAKFSEEEETFLSEHLVGLSPSKCRAFLDMGRWEDLPDGTVLTRQGQRPNFLTYLASGAASVVVDDRVIAGLRPKHYVGEMSFLGDDTASATVTLNAPSRVWRVETPKIERLDDDHPAIWSALRVSFANDMRRKIVIGNSAASVRDT
jgi:hypothetical protein